MNPIPIPKRPRVLFLGDIDHADFRDAANLLRAHADLLTSNSAPELILVAHSRPGSVRPEQLKTLRRSWPLAGIVVLAGSWCEGESRTGRTWPGVHRLYWYEFPAWWRRQLALCAAGRCPDWFRAEDQDIATAPARTRAARQASGLILLHADVPTSNTLADSLHRAGYASVRPEGTNKLSIRGASAAIWDGGQLSDKESQEFCAVLAADRIPMLAILDFPRRDRVDRAIELGASAVLGKPWRNAHLLAAVESITTSASLPAAA